MLPAKMKDRSLLWLAVLVVAALLVRLFLVFSIQGMGCLADECGYLQLARGIQEGRGLEPPMRCAGASLRS